jgi:hypothetical protein
MIPASNPSNNVTFMLGQLMERTEGLPEMRETVARTEQRVAALEDKFDKHDEDMRRMRVGVANTRTTVARLRGKWQGAAVVLLLAKDVVLHFWPKGAH